MVDAGRRRDRNSGGEPVVRWARRAGWLSRVVGLGLLFLAGGGCVGGVALGWAAVTGLREQMESEAWPRARGEVMVSQVVRTARSAGGVDERADVTFSYDVEGRTHLSRSIRLGEYAPSGFDPPAAVVGRYPTGAAVAVAYSPSQPERAMLEPGLRAGDLWVAQAALAWTLATLSLAAWGMEHLRKGGRMTVGGRTWVSDEFEALVMTRAGPASRATTWGAATAAVTAGLWEGFLPGSPVLGFGMSVGLTVAATSLTWAHASSRWRNRWDHLLVDVERGLISPAVRRGGPTSWAFDEIGAVRLRSIAYQHGFYRGYRYQVWLVPPGEHRQAECVLDTVRLERAEAVRGWILDLMGREGEADPKWVA